MARLQLKNLSKSFGATRVLHPLDLEIEDGEFVVFVGPSGCGKTTLLRTIAGLEEISEGEIRIDGALMNNVDASERGLSMVFQSYALYPHMTVYQNMAFGLKLAKTPKAEIDRRVGEAAAILEIGHMLERLPKTLSGGQRQRVAIGRSIVRKPKIFLFDEPLSNLDAELRVQMRIQISQLHRQLGVTMIYVTHDQVEAMTLADKIVVLRGGRIEQVGSPLDLYNAPANKFVAGFIGSPAMNFLDGVVERITVGSTDVRIAGAGTIAVPSTAGLAPGDEISIGIRPEHLAVDFAAARGLPAEVLLSEQLGDETHIHMRLRGGQATMIAQVPGQLPVESGATIGVAPDVEVCHVFDANGNALISRDAASSGRAA
jgi:multiple sugar transport system ATP-binding protein